MKFSFKQGVGMTRIVVESKSLLLKAISRNIVTREKNQLG